MCRIWPHTINSGNPYLINVYPKPNGCPSAIISPFATPNVLASCPIGPAASTAAFVAVADAADAVTTDEVDAADATVVIASVVAVSAMAGWIPPNISLKSTIPSNIPTPDNATSAATRCIGFNGLPYKMADNTGTTKTVKLQMNAHLPADIVPTNQTKIKFKNKRIRRKNKRGK